MISEQLYIQLQLLPDYLGNHLLLTATALTAGILICLPLSFLILRYSRLQWGVLAFASVMQTIPGIALLALMVPLLGLIGFLPALIALFLYSMLPILRNTVTGIANVDPSLKEAADGLGMTANQRLLQVELPLALPVIIAGIRTAAIWVVGTATLSTPVGATSLGNYIFSGLHTQNYTAVLVGCVAAAVLAIVLDQLIRLIEIAYKRRSRKLMSTAVAGLLIVLVGGIMPIVSWGGDRSGERPIVIGSKLFTEQYILGATISGLLKKKNLAVEHKAGMGSTILYEALKSGQVDCYIDYSGTIWTNIMKRTEIPSRQQVLDEMTEWLDKNEGVLCLGAIGFENAYALGMRRTQAQELGITTISDLAPLAPAMEMGGDYDFFSRPEWIAVRNAYGLRFKKLRSFDPSLMYSAVAEEEVDVISAFSTDGRIIDFDLIILDDPLSVLPPYDAVLLISPDVRENQKLLEALQPLIGSISDDMMREANNLVDLHSLPVENAADTLLRQIINSK